MRSGKSIKLAPATVSAIDALADHWDKIESVLGLPPQVDIPAHAITAEDLSARQGWAQGASHAAHLLHKAWKAGKMLRARKNRTLYYWPAEATNADNGHPQRLGSVGSGRCTVVAAVNAPPTWDDAA